VFFTSLRKSEGRRQAKNRHARVVLSRAVSAHHPRLHPYLCPRSPVPVTIPIPVPSHSISTMFSSPAYPSIHPFRAPAARHHCDRKRKPPPGTTTRILHSIKFSSQGQIAHHSNSIRTASSLIPSRTGALAYLAAVLIVHVTRIVSRACALAQISLTV